MRIQSCNLHLKAARKPSGSVSGNGLVLTRRQAIIWWSSSVPRICVSRPQSVTELLRKVTFLQLIRADTTNCYFPRIETGKNGRHFAYDIFKFTPLHENCFILIKNFFVPKGPINNMSGLLNIMTWRWSSDKPLSEPTSDNHLYHFTNSDLLSAISCTSGAFGLPLSVWIWIPLTLTAPNRLHSNGN